MVMNIQCDTKDMETQSNYDHISLFLLFVDLVNTAK